jgi:hypothetical protein
VGRPALAATGVFLVIFCAAGGALVAARSNHRLPYLLVTGNVPEGSTISAGELSTVDITPGAGIAAVPAAEESQVLGRYAAEELVEGTLLSPGELSSGPPLGAGDALVGATLAADQLPAGISAGDSVLVVLTNASASAGTGGSGEADSSPGEAGQLLQVGEPPAGSTGDPTGPAGALDGPPGTVLATATVVAVELPADTSGSPTTGGLDVVTLAIDRAAAAAVTAASAADEMSLAVVPPATAPSAATAATAPPAAGAGKTAEGHS